MEKPAQFLAEMMCRREAEGQGTNLPQNFWKDYPWKTKFGQQCVAANSLLKIYDFTVILEVLNKKKNNKVYSLRCPWIKDEFVEAQLKFEQRKSIVHEPIVVEGTKMRTNTFGNKVNLDG